MTSITTGNDVTSIPAYEFQGCNALTSITFGRNVTSIGLKILNNDYVITSMTFLGLVAPQVVEPIWTSGGVYPFNFPPTCHAYRSSNFPPAGGNWNGFLMGDAIDPGLPGVPAGLKVVAGNAQVSLNWTAPINNGGATIDYYEIYENGTILANHYTLTSTTINGLVNGVTYAFAVAAHNSIGIGPSSSSISVSPSNGKNTTTPTVPGVPTGLTATSGNAQVGLEWTAPSDNGGATIDYYLIYENGTLLSNHFTSTSTTITQLVNGVTYTFAVVAHNSNGDGMISSSVSASPTSGGSTTTVPVAPTDLTATPGNAQVSLNWAAPNNNGGATIDYYEIYENGTVLANHYTLTSIIITGLTNGVTYAFAVAAHNSIGIGPTSSSIGVSPSNGKNTTTPTVPGVPTGLTATSGNAQVGLEWTAPSDNGGATIDYYLISENGNLLATHYTLTSATITGLTNGVTYAFGVAAHNLIGIGPNTASISITPTNGGNGTVPTITAMAPTGSSVPTTTTVSVAFSVAMSPTTTTIVVDGIAGTTAWSGNAATFTPSTTLISNTVYTVTVTGKDAAGNSLVSTTWSFTTMNNGGTIEGVIMDANGGPIANATIIMSNGLVTRTDAFGRFSFTNVTAGSYDMSVGKDGYHTISQNVNTTAGQMNDLGFLSLPATSSAADIGLIIGIIVAIVAVLLISVFAMRKQKGRTKSP